VQFAEANPDPIRKRSHNRRQRTQTKPAQHDPTHNHNKLAAQEPLDYNIMHWHENDETRVKPHLPKHIFEANSASKLLIKKQGKRTFASE